MKEGTTTEFKNIILVDDDSDDRELFTEALSFIHPLAEIQTKRDGEELMEYLSNISRIPDVIFLDLNMPRKNGKACLQEIRANKQFENTPIVIYTTSLNPIDIQETFSQGASFFLKKPNSFEELKHILHNLLYSQLTNASGRSRAQFVVSRTISIG